MGKDNIEFNKIKEGLKKVIGKHNLLTVGRDWTDKEYTDYIVTEYLQPEFLKKDDDFCSYKITDTQLYICDFCVFNKRTATEFLFKLFDIGAHRLISCNVHITNIEILNILIRNKFRIKNLIGYAYYLERKGQK